jgi:hypothetical protein
MSSSRGARVSPDMPSSAAVTKGEGWAWEDRQKGVADGTGEVVAFVPAPGEENRRQEDRWRGRSDRRVSFAEVGEIYVIAVEGGFAGIYGEEDAKRELADGLRKGAA